MPQPAPADRLFETIARSGLLPPALLQGYRSAAGSHADNDPLAGLLSRLVADGLLTPYQAEQLAAGRPRGYFLAGKYKVLDLLGSGGAGHVFLCEHLLLRRLVAVKTLQRAAHGSQAGAALERFLREARAVAALDHPNIVRVFDMDRAGAVPFMVMEFVDGSSLHQIVARAGRLPVARAAHYLRQAALGLQHAHEHGLVHRDVKPGNLLLDRGGTVKLTDLGLARFYRDVAPAEDVTARYHEDHTVVGTADYMSPEQGANSSAVDIRSDIYSLGVTAYFFLTGRAPFEEESVTQKLLAHQIREPVPVRELRPEVPEGLAAAVGRMMAKDPARRFQTPGELAAALEPWAADPVPPPPPDEMPLQRLSDYRLGLSPDPAPAALATTPDDLPVPLPSAGAGIPTPSGGFDHTRPAVRPGYPPPAPTSALPGDRPAAPPRNRGAEAGKGGRIPPGARAVAAGLVVFLAAGLIWWFASRDRRTEPAPPPPAGPGATGDLVLTGSGSTFIKPAMDYWAPLYEKQTGARVKYDGIGSGRGVDNMIDRVLDFGCTDAPLTDAQLAKAREKNGEVLHIPLALGAVAATYNLPDLPAPLRFTGPVLADIFLGKIGRWNHRALAASNPGVALPDLPITVVHRSDSSGTTFIWTDFLSKASGEWKARVGARTLVNWPVGEEGEKNEGVAKGVSRTVGAIGYVELSYALEKNLEVGRVQNQNGRYVAPTLEGVTAAANAALRSIPADLRFTLTDAPGDESYPVAGTAWAVLYVNQPAAQARELVQFLRWATREGQAHLKQLRYAPLPPALVARIDEKLAAVPTGN